MTAKPKKKSFIFIMSALTGIASCGCYWQANRYAEATRRWQTLESELTKFKPYELKDNETKSFPWYTEKNFLKDWEYRLVKIKGNLRKERIFVRRTKEGRMGYYVMASLITSERKQSNQTVLLENGVVVNLGWVPLENKEEVLLKASTLTR